MVVGWDLESGPAAQDPGVPGALMFYLWGFTVVFTIAVAFGEWAWGKTRRVPRETLWTYFVMALLWPLFVCSVLFLILWNALTRPPPNR